MGTPAEVHCPEANRRSRRPPSRPGAREVGRQSARIAGIVFAPAWFARPERAGWSAPRKVPAAGLPWSERARFETRDPLAAGARDSAGAAQLRSAEPKPKRLQKSPEDCASVDARLSRPLWCPVSEP